MNTQSHGKLRRSKKKQQRLLYLFFFPVSDSRVTRASGSNQVAKMGQSTGMLLLTPPPIFLFSHLYFPASGRAVATGAVPSPSRFLPSIFIAHRVQQSHCSSIFHRVLPTQVYNTIRRTSEIRMCWCVVHATGFRAEESLMAHFYHRPTAVLPWRSLSSVSLLLMISH